MERKLGKKSQFWLKHLDLLQNQNMIHLAVQENKFDCRLYAWQEMLPLYFATNHVNYTRYGSYYLEMLKNLDQSHPAIRKLLLKKGWTAQAQEKNPCRTAIDQREKQSMNQDAKTTDQLPSLFSLLLAHIKKIVNWSRKSHEFLSLLKVYLGWFVWDLVKKLFKMQASRRSVKTH